MLSHILTQLVTSMSWVEGLFWGTKFSQITTVIAKSSVLCVFLKFVDHVGRRGDTEQALNRWWHPVDFSEAPDVLHWVMRPALYRGTCMAIEIASESHDFFVFIDSLFAYNLQVKDHVMVNMN